MYKTDLICLFYYIVKNRSRKINGRNIIVKTEAAGYAYTESPIK